MKKLICLSLSFFLIFSVAACSKKSKGKTGAYDFNGTWMFSNQITEDLLTGATVGMEWQEAGVITQNGTAFTITMSVVFSGTCDPAAWTFNVSNTDQGITTILTGSGEDQNSMAGNFTVQSGSTVRLRGVWSAELLNR